MKAKELVKKANLKLETALTKEQEEDAVKELEDAKQVEHR